jgi:hypothetical protein
MFRMQRLVRRILFYSSIIFLFISDSTMSKLALERTRPILMGGNWKLNPQSVYEAGKLATKIFDLTTNTYETEIVLFPPFTLIPEVKESVGESHIKVMCIVLN